LRSPIPQPEGSAIVQRIKQCSEPRNKKCRCDVRQEYFGYALD